MKILANVFVAFVICVASLNNANSVSSDDRFVAANRVEEAGEFASQIMYMRSCNIAEEDVRLFQKSVYEVNKSVYGELTAKNFEKASSNWLKKKKFTHLDQNECFQKMVVAGQTHQFFGTEQALISMNGKFIPATVAVDGNTVLGIISHFDNVLRKLYDCPVGREQRMFIVGKIRRNVAAYLDSRLGEGEGEKSIERASWDAEILSSDGSADLDINPTSPKLCGLYYYILGANLQLSEQLANPLSGQRGVWLDKRLRSK